MVELCEYWGVVVGVTMTVGVDSWRPGGQPGGARNFSPDKRALASSSLSRALIVSCSVSLPYSPPSHDYADQKANLFR